VEVKPGDIYSVASDDGKFSVVKILAVQPGVLTVRLYTNVYDVRPATLDPSTQTPGRWKDGCRGGTDGA
jgi:hypothetical protein